METPQIQTPNTEPTIRKSWAELEAEGHNPIDFISTPHLDETTVPEKKRGIYDAIIAAEHSAIEAEAESAAEESAKTAQEKREQFLKERAKERKDLSDIAVRSSLAIAINEQPARESTLSTVGTYQTGYMTPKEVDDALEARRNGSFN